MRYFKYNIRGLRRGFTLVELLIVMVMLAIIIAIALPQFVKYISMSYKTEIDSDARNAYTAAQAYLIDHAAGKVDSAEKLKLGGLFFSSGVSFVTGDFRVGGGSLELKTTDGKLADNNVVVFHNGRIEFPNMPR